MRDYELTVVFSPEVPEDEIGGEIDKVSELVTQKGGVMVGEVNRWGRRRLAYPIDRFREGNYVLAHFKLEAPKATELDDNLKRSENILRHLLVRLDG